MPSSALIFPQDSIVLLEVLTNQNSVRVSAEDCPAQQLADWSCERFAMLLSLGAVNLEIYTPALPFTLPSVDTRNLTLFSL